MKVIMSPSTHWMAAQLLLTILQSEASLPFGQRPRKSSSVRKSVLRKTQSFPCSVQEPPHCSTMHPSTKSNNWLYSTTNGSYLTSTWSSRTKLTFSPLETWELLKIMKPTKKSSWNGSTVDILWDILEVWLPMQPKSC